MADKRVIQTTLRLDQESEFKKQLSAVDRQLKNFGSDVKLLTAEFEGNANSMEALTQKGNLLQAQYDQQKEKAAALADRIKKLEEAEKGNNKVTDEYRIKLKNTQAAMIGLKREIQDNNRYLDEARSSADKAAHSIDGFGREVKESAEEVKESADGMDNYGQTLKGFIGDLGKLKGAIIGGAAVGAIKELGGAILEVEESTREYRQVMNSLMDSGEAAGIAAENTAGRYKLLNGVMGDYQAAAEATAQLQTLKATEEQLNEATISVIGSWSKLGGAAPIETIAESISQTVAASQATGAFSDILMATGQNEEEFNAKLVETADASERLDLVLQTLAAAGMKDLGESYLKNNEAAIQANQTQDRLNASWAALGEVLAPVANLIRNETANAVDFLTEKVSKAIDGVQDLISWWEKAKGVLAESGGLKGLFTWETLSKTPAQLEAEAQAAKTMRGLTGSELREAGLTSADVYGAAAAAVNAADAMAARGSNAPTMVHTSIYIDANEIANAITPAMREADKSNPEVVSDLL